MLAIAGVVAVAVLAIFTSLGLPLDTRYAFLASAILAIFCGGGVFGWMVLERAEHSHMRARRWWPAVGLVLLAGLVAYMPAQVSSAHKQLSQLARQEQIESDLVALVNSGAIGGGCGEVGVPNHAPVPLLALYLKVAPARIVSAQVRQISEGTYVDPASSSVEKDYVLDRKDPVLITPSIPPGFVASSSNASWLLFKHCA
jgi:hypothetical protein